MWCIITILISSYFKYIIYLKSSIEIAGTILRRNNTRKYIVKAMKFDHDNLTAASCTRWSTEINYFPP